MRMRKGIAHQIRFFWSVPSHLFNIEEVFILEMKNLIFLVTFLTRLESTFRTLLMIRFDIKLKDEFVFQNFIILNINGFIGFE